MLGLLHHTVGNWLFFAVGVSPEAALASVTFTWAAVRSSLGVLTQQLASPRMATQKHLLPVIVAMAAAVGLAGCAGQSDQHVQFFKSYASGQVDQRYLGMQLVTVSQIDQIPPQLPPQPK